LIISKKAPDKLLFSVLSGKIYQNSLSLFIFNDY